MNSTAAFFDLPRGLGEPLVRDSYAQVLVSFSDQEAKNGRLEALNIIQSNGLSIDFLKFTHNGVSFVISADQAKKAAEVLANIDADVKLSEGRSILLIPAVNMRDDEGLLAHVLSEAIKTKAEILHIGDMHDRVLIVTDTEGAKEIAAKVQILRESLA
jgi:aspartokinase